MKKNKIGGFTLFKALVIKEFRHVIRDRRSLIILIGLPVILMLMFGFALSNEVKNSRIAILDYSKDVTSQKLVERLGQSKYFDVAYNLQHVDEIESHFKDGTALLAMIIPSKFDRALKNEGISTIQIISDGSDPNTAGTAIRYVSRIVADFQRDIWPEIDLPYKIKMENRMLYNPQLESSYNFVPGVMALILMLLGAMMTSVAIVKEKEMGTMEVLLVSPMKPRMIILSKVVPYLVLCMIDIVIILIMAYTVLGMPIRGSLPLLLIESTLFILTTLALGMFISTKVESQQVAMFLSLVGFLMPSLVFSGFMFPIENMPKALQVISNVVPTRWFFDIVKNIMVKGLGFSSIIKESAILLGMTIFFMVLAMKNFKIRLQ